MAGIPEQVEAELTRLRALLRGGLAATAAMWGPVEVAYAWVFRAAAILANVAGLTGSAVKASYRGLLGAMARYAARAAHPHSKGDGTRGWCCYRLASRNTTGFVGTASNDRVVSWPPPKSLMNSSGILPDTSGFLRPTILL